MRLTILCLPGLILGLMLAGCDREKAEIPQGDAGVESRVPSSAEATAFPAGRIDRSKAGSPAPGIPFEDLDGRSASLADFRGRPLLVNLWATWCAPCVVEMPSLDALAKREGDSLAVVAISQDFGGHDKVATFFQTHGFTELEPWVDGEMRFMTELGASTLPTTILYDSDGLEVWRMTGLADWKSEESARLIAQAETG